MTTSRDDTIPMFSIRISVFVVTEIKKVELKKKNSLAGNLSRRLLRASRGFQESASLQERDTQISVPRNDYYNYQEEIKTALEAEHKEAEALLQQRRLFIC